VLHRAEAAAGNGELVTAVPSSRAIWDPALHLMGKEGGGGGLAWEAPTGTA